MRLGSAARILLLVAGALTLTGCASALEKSNRFFFKLNDAIDKTVVRPAVCGYESVVPEPIRTAVSNFFLNLTYVNVILNDFLQGKGGQGWDDTKRFVVNSTVGIGGLLDVAKRVGLERHEEDFGQTLGVWGVGQGPYIVLPLLGPSTARDAWLWPFRVAVSPLTYAPGNVTAKGRIVGLFDERYRYDKAIRARDQAAVDPFVFTREAYLQRREFLVHDGNPPEPRVEEDFEDLLKEIEEP